MSIWLNWMVICFLNPLLEYFDIWYWLEMRKWDKVRGEGKNSLLTQQEANMYVLSHRQKY